MLIDLTDVGDEANRWEIINNRPILKMKKFFIKKMKVFLNLKKKILKVFI